MVPICPVLWSRTRSVISSRRLPATVRADNHAKAPESGRPASSPEFRSRDIGLPWTVATKCSRLSSRSNQRMEAAAPTLRRRQRCPHRRAPVSRRSHRRENPYRPSSDSRTGHVASTVIISRSTRPMETAGWSRCFPSRAPRPPSICGWPRRRTGDATCGPPPSPDDGRELRRVACRRQGRDTDSSGNAFRLGLPDADPPGEHGDSEPRDGSEGLRTRERRGRVTGRVMVGLVNEPTRGRGDRRARCHQ